MFWLDVMKSCHVFNHFWFASVSLIKVDLFYFMLMGCELSFLFSKLKIL